LSRCHRNSLKQIKTDFIELDVYQANAIARKSFKSKTQQHLKINKMQKTILLKIEFEDSASKLYSASSGLARKLENLKPVEKIDLPQERPFQTKFKQ